MQYFITNEVRRQSTRIARAMAPTRAKFTQRICGNTLRLVRGRNRGIAITEELLLKYQDELHEKQKKGLIAVRTGSFSGPLVEFSKLASPIQKEEAPKEEVSIPEEVSTQSAEKSPDKMNKAELIEYASVVLGESSEDLEVLTKRQIMERLK